MHIVVINGPNLNMLGIREPDIYGKETYKALLNKISKKSDELGIKITTYQSNHEGDIVDKIQNCYFDKIDGIVINAGAYTHTSVAILDALKSVNIPAVEVHISDINEREDFRKKSYLSLYCEKIILGKGTDGYIKAIDYLFKNY